VQWRYVDRAYNARRMRCVGATAYGDSRQQFAAVVAFELLHSCTFRVNPHFDLEADYITRKQIVHRIQRYILCREILSTFHTRVDHRSVRHFCIIKYTVEFPKNAGNHATSSPFPLRHVDFHLTHECLGPPHSPPQTAPGSNQPCCHCSHVRTERWEGRMFYSNSALLIYSDRQRRAKNSPTGD